MKTTKLLFVSLFMIISNSLLAQNAGTFNFGENNVYLQVNTAKLNYTHDTFSGFALGYSRMIGISKEVPLFVEPGLRFRWLNNEENITLYEPYYEKISDTKYNSYTLELPVNIGYQINIGKSNFSIAPYAGIKLQYHVYGETKDKIDDTNIKWFDVDGSHRFQLGYNVGAHVSYKHFLTGVSYGNTFGSLLKDETGNLKFKNEWAISLGYRF